MTWSTHRTTKKLDRVGRATARDFWFLTHDPLIAMVEFDLTHNNKCWAVGQCVAGCIPMGAPSSAQFADLHYIWCTEKKHHLFKRLRSLIVSDAGFAYCVGRWTDGLGTTW